MQIFENIDCLEGCKKLDDKSVDCVITSPPYYQLRDYGYPEQWGLEPTYQEYLEHLWVLMDEIFRVLKDEGTVWINLGDSYSGSCGMGSQCDNKAAKGMKIIENFTKGRELNIPHKSLMLIPHRFAIGCIDRGWILRNDIIWAKCLSGGTKLYAKTSKGIFPQTIHDLARLKDVELWTGKKWSKVKGFYENKNFSDPLEITLRSGEKIACTKEHRFPTKNGLKRADELVVGDSLLETRLPESDTKQDILNSNLIAWFVGLYLAEGSKSENIIQISSHQKELKRFEKCKQLAESFGGTCNRYVTSNNGATINISSGLINAIIEKFITGKTAKNKHMTTDFWQRDNQFLDVMLKSYLDADAHYEEKTNRFRLGFTDNKQLADDLRTISARLGYSLRIKRAIHKIKDSEYKGYRGELRFNKSKHTNNKLNTEIIKISKSNGRKFWDIEISDEPHLFALASGVLTHNSNGMPESVTDRFSKKHEFIFFFTKQQKYYFDLDGVRDVVKESSLERDMYQRRSSTVKDGSLGAKQQRDDGSDIQCNPLGKNPGDVSDFWDVNTKPSSEKHYATYNTKLIDKPILAGCPKGGVILDPFAGTGTTLIRAMELDRDFIGFEMSKEYFEAANKRIEDHRSQYKLAL